MLKPPLDVREDHGLTGSFLVLDDIEQTINLVAFLFDFFLSKVGIDLGTHLGGEGMTVVQVIAEFPGLGVFPRAFGVFVDTVL